MNKKQKNRKLVSQTNRNRMINRHYKSTMKTIAKDFFKKIRALMNEEQTTNLQLMSMSFIRNHLYSAIDKAVKKGVIHKNTAARKKSRIHSLIQFIK